MDHYSLIQYLSYNATEIRMMPVPLPFDTIRVIQYYRDSNGACAITVWYNTCLIKLQRFDWWMDHYRLIQYLPYNTTEIRSIPVSLLFDAILVIQYYRDSNDAYAITVWYNIYHIILQRFDDAGVITVWYNTCHTILQRFEWCMCHYSLIQYLSYNTAEIRMMPVPLPFDTLLTI